MWLFVGSYVQHKKLAELGTGVVTKAELGTIRIRFESGEKDFAEARVLQYLEVMKDGPASLLAPARKRAARKAGALKATATKASKSKASKASAAAASASKAGKV